MDIQENLEAIMQLIMFGGDAKSKAMEAINCAKKFDFQEAEKMIQEANESLVTAHHSQSNLLTKEANGDCMQVTLLAVHAQDHLMTSISFIDLAKEVIDIYKNIQAIKN